MKPIHKFAHLTALALSLFFVGVIHLKAQTDSAADDAATTTTPDWRTWTSTEGAEIEAYLKNVTPQGIVIVRRDGREFTAPLTRFSEADRAYVAEWMETIGPTVANVGERDIDDAAVPDEYTIEDIENLRPDSNEPPESAAVRTVLTFHDIPFSASLSEQLEAREPEVENEAIPAPELITVLANLPLEAEVLTGGEASTEPWEVNFDAIRSAIARDLPVLIAYRPYFEPETLESVVVAIGYDRGSLDVLEPLGGNDPIPLDIDDLEEQFMYALILFPAPEPSSSLTATPSASAEPSREFLSQISSAIMNVPNYEPEALTEYLGEMGMQVTMRDVNRNDLRTQLGQTRSFARTGGLPLLDASLNRGSIIITPLELDAGQGFALIYGTTDEAYLGVEFLADRTFRREPIPRNDLAERWLTRNDRTYRLDLIEITVPPGGGPVAPPPPNVAPPRGGPPTYRPPPPPRR